MGLPPKPTNQLTFDTPYAYPAEIHGKRIRRNLDVTRKLTTETYDSRSFLKQVNSVSLNEKLLADLVSNFYKNKLIFQK